MKILYITRAYGENGGGMERLSYEMSAALRRQNNLQLSILKFTGPRLLSPLFNILITPQALMKARKADVVYLGDPMLSWVGWLIKKIYHKPVAVTVHGLDIAYPNLFYQIYLRLFGKKFELYLPISDKANDLISRMIPARRRHVINPGLVDRYYDPLFSKSGLFRLVGQHNADKIILFTCGRLVKRKGQAWFIANILPELPNNVIYVIAGLGPDLARIKRVIRLYNMSDRVILLGRVSDENLKVLYNTADAFIQPNISVKNDVEGFGLTMLEAALCCRAVFASNIDGIPSAIHSGKNGQLLPAENSQAWITTLTEYVKSPSSSGEARSYTLANFSRGKQTEEIVNSLEALVENREARKLA